MGLLSMIKKILLFSILSLIFSPLCIADIAVKETRKIPEHNEIASLPENPEPSMVTNKCLECHEDEASDFIETAHWLWKGPSLYTVGHTEEIRHGKAASVLNNCWINLSSNEARCTSCHAGYGWKNSDFDFTDKTKIDCLVCHDTTGKYKKVPTDAGMPEKTIDLKVIAENVGSTSRATCGSCHFYGGGGDAIKHPDLSSKLINPSRNCDIHMGEHNFACAECHKTVNHRIYGRSSSSPAVEGIVTCADCHSETPHNPESISAHHLNEHCKSIDCNTCHSPLYAKCQPTMIKWDWSKAGDKTRKPKKDEYGKPDYTWKKGELEWKQAAAPSYEWFDGYMNRIFVGEKVDTNIETIKITSPRGSFDDPKSKITPFKIMKGRQAVDAKNNYFLIPHLFPRNKQDTTAYWKNLDWQKAFEDGMQSAGLDYSGTYKWVETSMHWRITHEVMPASSALSCVQCHSSLKKDQSCTKCHKDDSKINFHTIEKNLSSPKEITNYIHFEALGYKGDPIIYGGRFEDLPSKP